MRLPHELGPAPEYGAGFSFVGGTGRQYQADGFETQNCASLVFVFDAAPLIERDLWIEFYHN